MTVNTAAVLRDLARAVSGTRGRAKFRISRVSACWSWYEDGRLVIMML